VPKPSIVPTTSAQVMVSFKVDPKGNVTTVAKKDVSLKAINNTISLAKDFKVTALRRITMKATKDIGLTATKEITLNSVSVKAGVAKKAVTVVLRPFYDFMVNFLFDDYDTHIHTVTGSVTGPPIKPSTKPKPKTSLSINTKVS
jgi:hypothetical protein